VGVEEVVYFNGREDFPDVKYCSWQYVQYAAGYQLQVEPTHTVYINSPQGIFFLSLGWLLQSRQCHCYIVTDATIHSLVLRSAGAHIKNLCRFQMCVCVCVCVYTNCG